MEDLIKVTNSMGVFHAFRKEDVAAVIKKSRAIEVYFEDASKLIIREKRYHIDSLFDEIKEAVSI